MAKEVKQRLFFFLNMSEEKNITVTDWFLLQMYASVIAMWKSSQMSDWYTGMNNVCYKMGKYPKVTEVFMIQY